MGGRTGRVYSWTRSHSQSFWRGGSGNSARWEISILTAWSGALAGSSCGTVILANRRPGDRVEFPANAIVDTGFLELVRYGIRDPHDPLIEDSLRVVDAVLKVETPFGPCWHRYNHDGYGQRDDGESYNGWGVGRAWPLLTGERGHYELAAGRDPEPYLRALENFSGGIGLIPEQI